MITIKTTTRTGKTAKTGTDKQKQFANDILGRINAQLLDIMEVGCVDVAEAVASEIDSLTDICEAGPMDIITYLKDVDIHKKAYLQARQMRDGKSVKAISNLI